MPYDQDDENYLNELDERAERERKANSDYETEQRADIADYYGFDNDVSDSELEDAINCDDL